MSANNFQVLEILGQGSYCTAYRVRRRSDGEIYAMKKATLSGISQDDVQNSVNEVRLLASVQHPNVVRYKEAFVEQDSLFTVMEFCNSGDLLQRIQKHKAAGTHFPEAEIWNMLSQIARGLRALHNLQIVHRDVKSANIFISNNSQYKLGDMNISTVAKDGPLHTQAGTPYYASPEVWKGQPCDFKSDVWSLGCVVYEMAALEPPFTGDSLESVCNKVVLGEYPPLPECYSGELGNMIGLLLRLKAEHRPSCNILLDYAVVKGRTQPEQEPANVLLETIKLPTNLLSLKGRLPAPQYHKLTGSSRRTDSLISPRLGLRRMLTDTRQSRAYRDQTPRAQPGGRVLQRETIAKKIQQLKDHYLLSPRGRRQPVSY